MEHSIEEALCCLQAQLHVHRLALQAFVRAHPDPKQLLSTWQAVLEQSPPYVPLAPADVRHSELLREQCRAYAEDWTADLVEWAVPVPGKAPEPGTIAD